MDEQLFMESIINLSEEEHPLTEKQEKVIEAAIDIFSKKGYASTSTKEIAKKAGVAEGTIFRHYATKKDLLIAIVSPVMKKLLAPFIINNFARVLDLKYESYESFLYAVLRNRNTFVKNNMPILRILLQEIPFHPELKMLFTEHIGQEVYDKIKTAVNYYKEQGEIIDIPTPSAIRLMASAGIGTLMVQSFLLPEIEWDEEEEIKRTVEFILHGLAGNK